MGWAKRTEGLTAEASAATASNNKLNRARTSFKTGRRGPASERRVGGAQLYATAAKQSARFGLRTRYSKFDAFDYTIDCFLTSRAAKRDVQR